MCCVCNGSCNHVGNHWYCNAHSAWLTGPHPRYYMPTVMPATFTVTKPYVGKHRKGDPEPGA